MVKIIVEEDCGNAPKKLLLRDLNIAYANRDMQPVLENLTDNIRWEMVGNKLIEGKEQVAEELEQRKRTQTRELILQNIITHGNVGAVDGIAKLDDGSSYAFCEVYRFSSHAKNAKIKEITSYIIEL